MRFLVELVERWSIVVVISQDSVCVSAGLSPRDCPFFLRKILAFSERSEVFSYRSGTRTSMPSAELVTVFTSTCVDSSRFHPGLCGVTCC